MKKTITILKIILLLALLLIIFNKSVYATTIDTDIKIGETKAVSSSKEFTERIVGVAQVVGTVISVAALVIIGIRYMISSIEEKAEMKGVLIYYIVGAILVFATTQVLGIIYNIMSNLTV